MKYRKIKDQIDKIIDISNSILTIYNNFIEMEITKDYSEYNTYVEYLQIAIDIENKAYQELQNLCNEEEFYKIYYYHMENKDISNQDIIEERIENHISYIYYGNKAKTKNKQNNKNKIIFAATTDFSYNLVTELNNEINTTTDIKYKNSLIKIKNEIIYSKKNIEHKLLKNNFQNRVNEKDMLIRMGQDESLVENTYLDFITNNINKNVNNIIFKYDKKIELENKIYLIFLKTHLKSLTKNEQINFLNIFNQFINDSDVTVLDIDGINKIIELLINTINENNSNKNKIKIKANNR